MCISITVATTESDLKMLLLSSRLSYYLVVSMRCLKLKIVQLNCTVLHLKCLLVLFHQSEIYRILKIHLILIMTLLRAHQ